MTREEKYDAVNKCETLVELADVILEFADESGYIRGRRREFPAWIMASACRIFKRVHPNSLTREFGIRQQAMYITFYNTI